MYWHTKFAILLAAGLILGAVGALALHNYGKAAMFIQAGSAGIIAGVVNAAAAGPAKEKRYDYYVNGVKVAERTKSSSNVPGYFLGGFLLVTVLVVVISFVISYICSLKKVATKSRVKEKENNESDKPYSENVCIFRGHSSCCADRYLDENINYQQVN